MNSSFRISLEHTEIDNFLNLIISWSKCSPITIGNTYNTFNTLCTLFPLITFPQTPPLPRCLHLLPKPSPSIYAIPDTNFLWVFSHDNRRRFSNISHHGSGTLPLYLPDRDHHKWFRVTKQPSPLFPEPRLHQECLQPSPHLLWNHRLACKGSMGWDAAKTEYLLSGIDPCLYKLQYHQKIKKLSK